MYTLFLLATSVFSGAGNTSCNLFINVTIGYLIYLSSDIDRTIIKFIDRENSDWWAPKL